MTKAKAQHRQTDADIAASVTCKAPNTARHREHAATNVEATTTGSGGRPAEAEQVPTGTEDTVGTTEEEAPEKAKEDGQDHRA